MTIPGFFGNARGTHSYANANPQIYGFLIAKENYLPSLTLVDWGVSYANQFPIIIKQFMEIFSRDRQQILNQLCTPTAISPGNAQLDQYIRRQLMQSRNLLADNGQLTLHEVFHVHS